MSLPGKLPNGYALAPVWFDESNIRLVDPSGRTVIPGHVDDVAWCDDIVYGVYFTRDGIFSKRPFKENSFIYVGKEEHLYTDADPALYKEQFQKYNLPKWPTSRMRYLDALNNTTPSDACPGRK